MENKLCKQCGKKYKVLAQHWRQSNCSKPDFSDNQLEIITGLLMGDGWIKRQKNRKPKLVCAMTSKNYLKHIDKQFGVLGGGVSLHKTSGQQAKNAKKHGFNSDAKPTNYNDLYIWRLMAHKGLENFSSWYASGEKIWPNNIKLSPNVLKHWYCCDGYWDNSGTANRLRIAMKNEKNNTEKVDKIFKKADLPQPKTYQKNPNKCDACFTVDQSHKLWSYMGKPLPDFKYKWPKKYHEKVL